MKEVPRVNRKHWPQDTQFDSMEWTNDWHEQPSAKALLVLENNSA